MLYDLTILPVGTDIDWQYQTTNEMNACLSTNGSCSWPRGKNLGGTSVHNGMMYTRGHAKDFNNWAAMGNVGWNWHDVRSHKPVYVNYFEYRRSLKDPHRGFWRAIVKMRKEIRKADQR